jgi:hypothetical protein
MSSILLLLAIGSPRVKYVLECDEKEEWNALIEWLNAQNIALCTVEAYDNPDSLKPKNTYCVKSGEAFKLFQVLVTQDWEDKENPAPQFVNDVAYLTWVYVNEHKPPACPDERTEEKKLEDKQAYDEMIYKIKTGLL